MKSNHFLYRVAERLLKIQESHPRCAVVFPNQRPGLYLKKIYIPQLIEAPIFAPEILTLEDLMSQISGLNKQDLLTQLLLLFNTYRKSNNASGDFSQFIDWATTFIADCNDIDNSLINASSFFRFLYTDKESARQWSPDEDTTTMQDTFLAFWRDADLIYHEFQDQLCTIGGGYTGFIYRKAIEKIDTDNYEPTFDYILFAGFNALNIAEEKLIDFYLSSGRGEIIWDTDSLYATESSTEFKAGNYYRKYIQKWPDTVSSKLQSIGAAPLDIQLIQAPTNVSQCDVAADLLKQLIDKNEDVDFSGIAIILADESLLEPLILRLPSQIGHRELHYNITMGKSLASFSLFHLFDKIIHLFTDSDKTGFSSSLIIDLAASLHWKQLDETDYISVLRREIIKRNISRLTRNKINSIGLSGVWQSLFSVSSTSASVIDFMLNLVQRLRAKATDSGDRQSIEVLFEFHKLFTNLQNTIPAYPQIIDLRSLRRIFRMLALQAKLPFEGEPINGVQIMGLLESRLLDFKHVILVSANEGKLPESKFSATHIPHSFRKYYGMPTYEERDAIFAYSFYRLLHQSSSLQLVYDSAISKMGANEKSRYILQLEATLDSETYPLISVINRTYSFLPDPYPSYSYEIKKTPEVINDILWFLKNKNLSASSIATLVRSPLDFYLQKVIGISEEDILQTDLEHSTFGQIVHGTLYDLYRPLINRTISNQDLELIQKEIPIQIIKNFKQFFGDGNTSGGYNYLLVEAAKIMVNEVINKDKVRITGHQMKILETEGEHIVTLDYNHDGTIIDIKIKGTIDRVQAYDDQIEIIDYKTGGRSNLNSKKINDVASDPNQEKLQQLLTYVYLILQQPNCTYSLEQIRPALHFLRYTQGDLSFIDSTDFRLEQSHIDTFLSNLRQRLDELLDPHIPLKPDSDLKRMKYSPYLAVYGLA